MVLHADDACIDDPEVAYMAQNIVHSKRVTFTTGDDMRRKGINPKRFQSSLRPKSELTLGQRRDVAQKAKSKS